MVGARQRLLAKGVQVRALIDVREGVRPPDLTETEVITGGYVIDSSGRKELSSTLHNGKKIRTDCLAVAGGWNQLFIHLPSTRQTSLNEDILAFVPGGTLLRECAFQVQQMVFWTIVSDKERGETTTEILKNPAFPAKHLQCRWQKTKRNLALLFGTSKKAKSGHGSTFKAM